MLSFSVSGGQFSRAFWGCNGWLHWSSPLLLPLQSLFSFFHTFHWEGQWKYFWKRNGGARSTYSLAHFLQFLYSLHLEARGSVKECALRNGISAFTITLFSLFFFASGFDLGARRSRWVVVAALVTPIIYWWAGGEEECVSASLFSASTWHTSPVYISHSLTHWKTERLISGLRIYLLLLLHTCTFLHAPFAPLEIVSMIQFGFFRLQGAEWLTQQEYKSIASVHIYLFYFWDDSVTGDAGLEIWDVRWKERARERGMEKVAKLLSWPRREENG